MSISKLESLPNEILINLLEKYMNAVDVFVAFANQLNSRFNALVNQCQQFNFNFTSIRKKDFQFCINLLPNYLDKIKSITLSECDTPEQIHLFLYYFPSLKIFNELREFHVDFDVNTVDNYQFKQALCSLSNSNLYTLSIKSTNSSQSRIFFSMDRIILSLPMLKRLVLDINYDGTLWNVYNITSFNLKHLTIVGKGCTWSELQHISHCVPSLSYLNVRIINSSSSKFQSTANIPILGKLRTVILDFIDRYTEVTWDDLVQYFHCMLNLHSLEVINSHDRFFSASDWQMLFETSLPLLTFFTLKIRAARLSQLGLDNIHRTLLSFQTSFWIEKTNFNIFVMMSKYFDIVIFNYQPIDPRQHPLDNGSNSEIEQGTIQFWIVPERFNSDNRCLTNVITSLRLSAMDPLPPSHYYFDNVTCLKVDYLNACLFEWITTHIRLSKITKLIIQRAEIGCPSATSLISLTENLSSLQINFCQWIFQQHDLTKTNHNMKRLYISLDFSYNEKTFRKNDICIIANIFPAIEHLKIDTIDFDCVPFLFACFSRLHSLTFKILDLVFSSSNDSKEQQWENRLRSIPKLAFKRTREWITIWLDDLTLQDSNWRSFSLESQFSRCISS